MVQLSQADTPDGLKKAIAGRIAALASVHSLFAQSRGTGAELGNLVNQELAPYSRDESMRTKIDAGCRVEAGPGTSHSGCAARVRDQCREVWCSIRPQRSGSRRVVAPGRRASSAPLEPGRRSARHSADGQGFRHPCDGGDDTGPLGGDVWLDWRAEGLAGEITLPM